MPNQAKKEADPGEFIPVESWGSIRNTLHFAQHVLHPDLKASVLDFASIWRSKRHLEYSDLLFFQLPPAFISPTILETLRQNWGSRDLEGYGSAITYKSADPSRSRERSIPLVLGFDGKKGEGGIPFNRVDQPLFSSVGRLIVFEGAVDFAAFMAILTDPNLADGQLRHLTSFYYSQALKRAAQGEILEWHKFPPETQIRLQELARFNHPGFFPPL